ncbi:hypothetical protein [Metasolibacillus sp.]|uniref:hypothetical protein n=1 Tax=Metasolibacillus sp. TaxID=2703680 RepID=UPI0025D0029E|nr:hypothetical protein [Metasolibacillus sp.]MCT6925377.1 hypothetical protein [Metasolibacillus sp.]MCT6941595.1 hypothetical protein [Metasolibacillus sp.]
MNPFKQQLHENLQRQAPFTKEIKERIVQKPRDKLKLAPIYIAVAIITVFLAFILYKPNVERIADNKTLAVVDQKPVVIFAQFHNAPLVNGELHSYFDIQAVNQKIVFTVENTGENIFTWKIYKPNNDVWYAGTLAPNEMKSYIIDDLTTVALGEYHFSVISKNGGASKVNFMMKEKEGLLPILQDGQRIDVQYSHLLGDAWMFNSTLIIDEKAPIQHGDYIAYYSNDGLIASTVLGVAGDKVTMEQGKVLVNDKAFPMHNLHQKIDLEMLDNPMKNSYFFHTYGNDTLGFANQTLQAKQDELIVYHNENGHTITTISEQQLAGKVIGVPKVEPTFELSLEEKALYDDFKASHNLELFRNIDPISIAKIYVVAEMQQDFAMYKALFTTVDNRETKEIRKYIEQAQLVREAYFTKEIERLRSARAFAGLEAGTFTAQSEDTGIITFFSPMTGEETTITMRKNAKSIWQPAFTRPIY